MAVLVSDLTKPLVKQDVLADLYTLGGLFGLTVPAMQPGEPIPTVLVKVVEWFVDLLWNPLVVPALQAPFLDWATGDWLTLIAALVYGRPRLQATAGTGVVVIENRSQVSGTVTIPVGSIRVKNTGSGIAASAGATYTNTTAATVLQWSGSGLYPVASPPLVFEADVVGTGSTALGGDIAVFPIVPTTSPSVGLYAQATTPIIIGSDIETDADLVVRCRAAVGSLTSNGSLAAYEDAALDPVGAFSRRGLVVPPKFSTTPAAIARIRAQDTGNATVHVALASNSGPAGGIASDPTTDVGAAAVAIAMFAVPIGITATVEAALALNANLGMITLSVTAESLVTKEEAIATATTALNAFISKLPIGGNRTVAGAGGFLYLNKLYGVIEAGPGVIESSLSGLMADLNVGDHQVVVLQPIPSWAVNIVPQGVS